jgi:hypothetical protein
MLLLAHVYALMIGRITTKRVSGRSGRLIEWCCTSSSRIGVPVATVRNWEQLRTRMGRAVRSLLRVIGREPDAVMRAQAEWRALGRPAST